MESFDYFDCDTVCETALQATRYGDMKALDYLFSQSYCVQELGKPNAYIPSDLHLYFLTHHMYAYNSSFYRFLVEQYKKVDYPIFTPKNLIRITQEHYSDLDPNSLMHITTYLIVLKEKWSTAFSGGGTLCDAKLFICKRTMDKSRNMFESKFEYSSDFLSENCGEDQLEFMWIFLSKLSPFLASPTIEIILYYVNFDFGNSKSVFTAEDGSQYFVKSKTETLLCAI